MIDSIAFQINRHSNGRVCDWLVNRIEAIIKATRVIVCTCENVNIAHPVRFYPIPPDSTRIEYYIQRKEMAGYAPRRISNSNKATDEKIIRICSKADRTMIEGNLSEKLTFVPCYFSNNYHFSTIFLTIRYSF